MSSSTDRRTLTLSARLPEQYLDLPSVLVKLMSDEPAMTEHLALAERYRALTEHVVELSRSHSAAKVADDEARRAALASGSTMPKPKAEKIGTELEQARADIELLNSAVFDSIRKLGERAIEFGDRAQAELDREQAATVQRMRDLFAACEDALADLEGLAAETWWIKSLRVQGRLAGWKADMRVRLMQRTNEAIRRLALELDADLGRQAELDELHRREREADAKLPAPPGSTIWRGGETLVVGEDGEVEEAER